MNSFVKNKLFIMGYCKLCKNAASSIIFLCMTMSGLQAQPITTGLIKRPMVNASVDAQGRLNITPAANSSPRDFDFLSGKYLMHNKRLKGRLNSSTEWIEYESTDENYGVILNGNGNLDILKTDYNPVNGKPYEGLTLRLFDNNTKLWSLYWVDHNTTTLDPVVGSFDGNVGTFYAKDSLRGKPILVEFRWDKTDSINPIWAQSFSPDNGLTWEMNITNICRRVK
jgi:hypothetical protein